MPKLHGMTATLPLNVFDSFDPRALLEGRRGDNGAHRHLFGNTNIGKPDRSNMLVGGQLESDLTGIIHNWYGRTNIAPHTPIAQRAWDNWVHASRVSLVIGCSPVHQVALSDLMARKEGQQYQDHPDGVTAEAMGRELGREAWSRGVPNAIPLHDAEWQVIALAAMRFLKRPLLACIPERQNFSVRIDTDDVSLIRNLCEVMPRDAAPLPLVWVHLEGAARRNYQ